MIILIILILLLLAFSVYVLKRFAELNREADKLYENMAKIYNEYSSEKNKRVELQDYIDNQFQRSLRIVREKL